MSSVTHNPVHRPVAGVFFCLWLALWLVLCLAGCATPPQTRAILQSSSSLPRAVELTATPFFAQDRYQCGPAALATLLVHSGVRTDAATLIDEVYLPGRQGSLQLELIGATRRHQRVPYVPAPTLTALLEEVAAGNPVLVLQNLGLDVTPVWHYAVVVGYDLDRQILVLRSGTTPRRITGLAKFERTWERSEYWGMVITPNDRIPVTATEQNYLAAVTELERLRDYPTAEQAYRAALARWPGSVVAALGLANTTYAQGDLAETVAILQTAVDRHPQAAVLLNNLAQALPDQGDNPRALGYAQRAVQLGDRMGDPLRAQFEQTRADIERRRARQTTQPAIQ